MSDIQLRVQTTFDINKNDLDSQLKQLQNNTNLKLDFDTSSTKNVVTKFKEIKDASGEVIKTITDVSTGIGQTARITETLNQKTGDWVKQIATVTNVQKIANEEIRKQEQAVKQALKAEQELAKAKEKELSPKEKNARDYYENIIKYVQQYKLGLMDLESYVNKLQQVMYKKDGSYSGQFMNMEYSKQLEVVKELTSALKTQQKVREETSKIKDNIDKSKEAERLQTQTKLYERLLQLQKESFNLQKQSISNSNANGELEKELQLQLQINQAKQNEISGKIKDGNLVNYEMEARLLNQIEQQQQQIAIKQAQRKQKEEEVNSVLQQELEVFKQQANLQIGSIEKRYGNVKGVKENIESFNEQLRQLEVRDGKLVNANTGAETSFKNLRREISNIRTEARNNVGIFDRLAEDAKKFITYLGMGNIVVNFANQIKQAFTYINEMNTALTNVQMITGQSAESVQGLTQEYINLGKELGMLSQDIAKVAEDYYRMGKDASETQTLIKNTGMMATLSGMEMGNATQAMTSIMNGYKMSVEDTAHVVDTLVSIDNNAATSVEEIATALSRCSNTALEAGVSFDTLAGYAGTISSVTRKSAESIGESLKTIMVE